MVLTPLKTPAMGGDKDTHIPYINQLSESRASCVPTSPEAEVGPTLLLAIWTAPSSAGLQLPHGLTHTLSGSREDGDMQGSARMHVT